MSLCRLHCGYLVYLSAIGYLCVGVIFGVILISVVHSLHLLLGFGHDSSLRILLESLSLLYTSLPQVVSAIVIGNKFAFLASLATALLISVLTVFLDWLAVAFLARSDVPSEFTAFFSFSFLLFSCNSSLFFASNSSLLFILSCHSLLLFSCYCVSSTFLLPFACMSDSYKVFCLCLCQFTVVTFLVYI